MCFNPMARSWENPDPFWGRLFGLPLGSFDTHTCRSSQQMAPRCFFNNCLTLSLFGADMSACKHLMLQDAQNLTAVLRAIKNVGRQKATRKSRFLKETSVATLGEEMNLLHFKAGGGGAGSHLTVAKRFEKQAASAHA